MNKLAGNYSGFPIYVSDRPDKKYYGVVNGKKVYFGQRGYEHYFDKMGHYSDLNHLDRVRRKAFKNRFERFRHNKGSAAWLSDKILW